MRLKMSVALKATFYPAELLVYLFGGQNKTVNHCFFNIRTCFVDFTQV